MQSQNTKQIVLSKFNPKHPKHPASARSSAYEPSTHWLGCLAAWPPGWLTGWLPSCLVETLYPLSQI